jgi:hypothetical protein
MYKRIILLLLVIFVCFPLLSRGQVDKPGFSIAHFTVYIEENSITKGNNKIPFEEFKKPDTPLKDPKAVFSGSGYTTIAGEKVPVIFKDIKIAKESLSEKIPRAESGKIRGKSKRGDQKKITYNIEGVIVQLEIDSVIVIVKGGTASVSVIIKKAQFFAGGSDNITLTSASCRIYPDGGIEGDNFQGSSVFMLKDSVYKMGLRRSDNQYVRLLPSGDGRDVGDTIRSETGSSSIKIRGEASRDGRKLFGFSLSYTPDKKLASFLLDLIVPYKSQPEPEYRLALKSGRVEYEYNATGLVSCNGSFKADVKLPPRIRDDRNNTITLSNITLNTDKTGVLFGNVEVDKFIKTAYQNESLKGSNIFLIASNKDTARMYFAVWHLPQYSSYPLKESDPCEELFQFLDPSGPVPNESDADTLTRPGLTIVQGIIYFKAAQVTFARDAPTDPFSLKAPFWGRLTCTHWGLTGDMTTSSYSFIPSNSNIDKSFEEIETEEFTFDEIVDMGNRKPQEPVERFLLSGFRVLGMKAESIRVCKNLLYDSIFFYTIHFPYPSYIALEFEDTTLNAKGRFQEAFGPLGSTSWELTQAVSEEELMHLQEQLPKGVIEVIYHPVSKIFFAWRLPVVFAQKGVKIKHSGSVSQIKAEISMESFDENNIEISSSELRASPLFSRHSAFKFGIRFKGKLDAQGGFELEETDQRPVFSQIYPEPGKEYASGFPCRNIHLSLAEAQSNPVSRSFDFAWNGDMRFPFFNWKEAEFLIKDLIPKKKLPESFALKEATSGCNVTAGVTVNELVYTPNNMVPFTSTKLEAYRISNNIKVDAKPIYMKITSYVNGMVICDGDTIPELPLKPPDRSPYLENAVYSGNIIDLVCYDTVALGLREDYGLEVDCCEDYYIGTLVVLGPDGKEKMHADNTKYYPGITPIKLELGGSTMGLTPEGGQQTEYDTVINIPSAQLAFNDDGMIQGAFGATYTSIASSLPYEGELKFLIDTQNGYFYVLSAGSFTYFLRFSGLVFIFHAPYRLIKETPPFIAVTGVLDDMSIRTLFHTTGDFKAAVGFDRFESTSAQNTVLTGALTAGNASVTKDLKILSLKIAAGPGVYVYRYKEGSTAEYTGGTFMNAAASASVLILELFAKTSLTGTFDVDEFRVNGSIVMGACLDMLLLECCAHVRGDVVFSSESGFDFSGSDVSASCD